MTFADKYASALVSGNLRSDTRHKSTDALTASAWADLDGITALLCRVRATDDAAVMDQLQALWFAEVCEFARARRWCKVATEWDATAAFKLFRRVASKSLAHWMDSRCPACEGNCVHHDDWECELCDSTGEVLISGSEFERERVKDMVSELTALERDHTRRAERRLR